MKKGNQSNTVSATKKQTPKKSKKFAFFWERKVKHTTSSDVIFINAKAVLFVALSLISGFINLVCISNLTKSPYIIGWLESKNCGWIIVPGAVVLGAISIGLDGLKCIHAIQINTLAELVRKTDDESAGIQKTVKQLKKVRIKWVCSYVLYVALSVLTSMSLALTSVGSAIRENETTINLITEDYNELALLKENQRSDKSDKRDVTRGNMSGNQTAVETAEKDAQDAWVNILEYREKRDDILSDNSLTEEEQNSKVDKLRDRYFTYLPSGLKRSRLDDIGLSQLKSHFATVAKNTETDTESAKILNDLIEEGNEEINAVILSLEGRYVDTKKQPVSFVDEDGNPVSISAAMGTLKTLKNEYQIGGNSDIGSSAKMFTIFADIINTKKDKDTSGFGTTETLIMIFLLFLSLLVEVGINQVSTKSKISRKLWGQFSQYYPKSFDVDHFMINVYIDQVRAGIMDIDECEKSCKEAVEMMKYTPEYFIRKYGDKTLKEKYGIADNVNIEELTEKQLKEIENYKEQITVLQRMNEELQNKEPEIKVVEKEVIKEVPVEKIVEKEIIKEVPVVVEKEKPVEVIKEKPVRKIVGLSSEVDKKAAELDDLIKDI